MMAAIAIFCCCSVAAIDPDDVNVRQTFGDAVTVSAGKSGQEPGGAPATVKHGISGPQTPGDPCHVNSDGMIYNVCWDETTPIDCLGPSFGHTMIVNICGEDAKAPVASAPQSPARAARDYAIRYLRSLPLPVPKPQMSAPQGICGAEHSLDLQIPSELVFTDPSTPFGTLAVHVHGRFDVDWGDGRSDTYFSSGAPWPKSTLTHYWENVGSYDIVVNAHWSADWTYGTHSGVLNGLSTTGAMSDWPVIQLQAVLRN